MNADVLQRIFDFADVEGRIQMRRIFGELFRYPRITDNGIAIKPVDIRDWLSGKLLRSPFWSAAYIPFLIESRFVYTAGRGFHYVLVCGPYRMEKTICYFCGHERVETFVGEHGMYAYKSLGSLCILPWCVRPACNKPRAR